MFGLDPILYFETEELTVILKESLNQSLRCRIVEDEEERMFFKRIEVFANFFEISNFE